MNSNPRFAQFSPDDFQRALCQMTGIKLSRVMPIFKRREDKYVINCKTCATFLSIANKVLEQLTHKQVYAFLSNKLNEEKHDFNETRKVNIYSTCIIYI